MKKWISLLLAGILVSAFMIGCNKEPEGSTATPPASGTGDGKMEEKKGTESATPDTKPGSTEGENKMDDKMASAAGDTAATPPAGDGKIGDEGKGAEGKTETK